MLDDLTERAQLGEFFRFEFGQIGITRLHGAENFDTLDRVNAEIRFHIHFRFERFNRVAGFLTDHFH